MKATFLQKNSFVAEVTFKGTVTQIEKLLINNRLCISKVS